MKSSSKESHSKSNEIWQLSQRLGISTWKNLLSLPESDNIHIPALVNLERSIKFTFVEQNPEIKRRKTQIFISEKTDLKSLCKYLPFLFNRFQVFMCDDNLIQQRILAFSHDEFLQEDNQAKKNLSYLLEKAAQENASDIHIESLSGTKRVRMRIDGKLRQISLPEDIDERLFIKIKLHSRMDIAQKRAPQDGHFPFISTDGISIYVYQQFRE